MAAAIIPATKAAHNRLTTYSLRVSAPTGAIMGLRLQRNGTAEPCGLPPGGGGAEFATVSNEYHFITTWRLEGTREEVAEVLRDPRDLPRWWPSVYLDVRVTTDGDARGVGRVAELLTKGWLPYTIRWRFTTTRNDGPHGLALHADGDFVGEGVWTFRQDGAFVDAEYDWRIRAEKPLLKRLTWLLRPAFSANHRWAMRKGEESMRLELARRKLPGKQAQRVGAPPGPTFAWLLRSKRFAASQGRLGV
jgi:hypothetical protein